MNCQKIKIPESIRVIPKCLTKWCFLYARRTIRYSLKNIDLNNNILVVDHAVKYHTLAIYLKNGKEIEICGQGWVLDYNYKYPNDDQVVEPADYYGIDED